MQKIENCKKRRKLKIAKMQKIENFKKRRCSVLTWKTRTPRCATARFKGTPS